MTTESASIDQLVQLAQSGSDDALSLLLLRCQPPLASFIQSQLGSKLAVAAGPDDILQETYEQVFRGWPVYDHESEAGLLAWLKTIATHRIQDRAKHEARKKRGGNFERAAGAATDARGCAAQLVDELSADVRSPSQFVARDEAVDAMQVAIAALPTEQQRVIRARYFDQKSIDEIATQLGRSSGSVRGLLHRARDALRERMMRASLWLTKRS